MAIIKGITKVKADAIEAQVLATASLNSNGELILTRVGGGTLNLGKIAETPNPTSPGSLVSLSAFDSTAETVVVPEWADPNRPNKRLTPITLGDAVNCVAWSPEGKYLAVANIGTTRLRWYKVINDSTFTELTAPASFPAGDAVSVAWSPNGQYLAAASSASPYLVIYKRSGDTLTLLSSTPSIPPGIACYELAWSPDSVYLAVGHDLVSGSTLSIYKRSSDTFTRLTNPGTLPANTRVQGLAFSPNGVYLVACSSGTGSSMIIYKRSGDTFTALATPEFAPTGNPNCLAFSPDGKYLCVIKNTAPFVLIYRRYGDLFVKIPDQPVDMVAATRHGVWSPGGDYLAVGSDGAPFVTIYKSSLEQPIDGTPTTITLLP